MESFKRECAKRSLIWRLLHDDMNAVGIQPIGMRQQNPDFIALAYACGWQAQVVESPSTLGTEIKNAFDRTEPVLLQLDQGLFSGNFQCALYFRLVCFLCNKPQ